MDAPTPDPAAAPDAPSPTPAPASRLIGLDVARALAILGMIVVHFCLVAAADQTTPPWMAAILRALDGRASAVFILLAGIGVTLMTRGAVQRQDIARRNELQVMLIRRGIALLVLGLLNLTIWSGDILRIYGVSLIVASCLFDRSSRALLVWAAAFALAFIGLFAAFDFSQNWDWETMTYQRLWTPSGQLRNLFYDGFRSVFPWTGLLIFGMWLGRLDLTRQTICHRLLLLGAATAAAAEGLSWSLLRWLAPTAGQSPSDVPELAPLSLPADEARALFGTDSMPALPLFLLAAGGTAVSVIALGCLATNRWPGRGWKPLVATGQMALTWYMAHILLGLGGLVALNQVGAHSLPAAAALGVAFFAIAVLVATRWNRIARRGPLETALRRLSEPE